MTYNRYKYNFLKKCYNYKRFGLFKKINTISDLRIVGIFFKSEMNYVSLVIISDFGSIIFQLYRVII